MKHLQKSLSLFLCIVLCLSFFPFSAAYAEEAEIVEEEIALIEDEFVQTSDQDNSSPEAQEELPVLEETVTGSENQPEDDSLVVEEEDGSAFDMVIEEKSSVSDDPVRDITHSGYCGDPDVHGGADVTWSLDDELTLTISGNGRMADCETGDMWPWHRMRIEDTIKSVVITEGVTSVGDRAFNGCMALESVSLPDSLTSIGEYSFVTCNSLTTFTIPDHVTVIKAFAFADSVGMTELTVPGNVKTVEKGAFIRCGALEHASMLSGVETIGDSAFSTCESLQYVVIPSTVTSIGGYAFSDCEWLTDVYYEGSAEQWQTLVNTGIGAGNKPLLYARIHCNDTGPEDDFGYVINSGNPSMLFRLDKSVESIVRSTASTDYNPELSLILAALSRAIYSESDTQRSLQSIGFDYDHAEKMFTDDEEHYCSGYVVAKKSFLENDAEKTLVMVLIRGSVGYNWNNLLDLGDSWTGTGQYPALRADAENVHAAIAGLLDGIPTTDTVYMITGHSQGAGAANILATMLYYDGVDASDVYAYTYACPNVACFTNDSNWNPGNRYGYIFNIENVDDIVPLLPSNFLHNFNSISYVVGGESYWGRYGRSYWFYPNEENKAGRRDFWIGHDMKFYVRALSYGYSLDSFATYSEVAASHANWFWRFAAISCPVDVTVYDKDGNPVAGVENNQAHYYDSQSGPILILVEGDKKAFCFPDDQDYDIRITATDSGEMSVKIMDFNLLSEEVSAEKEFSGVSLTPGKTMSGSIEGSTPASDVRLLVTDELGEPIREVKEDGTEIQYVPGPPAADESEYPLQTTLNMADFTGIFVYIGLPEGADASQYTVEAQGGSYRKSYAKGPVTVSSLPKGNGARAGMYQLEALRAGSPEMTDEVTVILKRGGTVVKTETYSVYSVAQGMLAAGNLTADQINLVKGLLQYGYYGHTVFKNPLGYNPNIDGAPALTAIPATYAAQGDPTNFGAYVTKFTEKLNLDSAIGMNLYLTLANGYSMNDFTYQVLDKDGNAYGSFSVEDKGNQQVSVSIGGIKSPQMARNFKLIVTLKSDPTKTATWTRSVWTCAYEGSTRTSGTGLSFLRALYQYGLYAQKQFPKVA